MPTDLETLRRKQIQAIGAGISTRNWRTVEQAYNQLRDKVDEWIIIAARDARAADARAPVGDDAAKIEPVWNGEFWVRPTLDDTALIERLRATVEIIKNVDDGTSYTRLVNPDGPEAADRLAELSRASDALVEAASLAETAILLARGKFESGGPIADLMDRALAALAHSSAPAEPFPMTTDPEAFDD